MKPLLRIEHHYSKFDDIQEITKNKEHKEKILKYAIEDITSDGRNYTIVDSGWQEQCYGSYVQSQKRVGIYLTDFNNAEFEDDVVIAAHLKNFHTNKYQDVNGRFFSAINPDKTLWKLDNGKKDLRNIAINPTTKFNPAILKIKLDYALTSDPAFFINQIKRAEGILESNLHKSFIANTLFLPEREYVWAKHSYVSYSEFNILEYVLRTTWNKLNTAAKQQLNNVAVLFANDGNETTNSIVKHPNRTTWLFAENCDELIEPKGVVILTW